MVRVAPFVRVSATLFCTALSVVGCASGEGGSGQLSVTSEVVSDATTQDIHVCAPRTNGAWPTNGQLQLTTNDKAGQPTVQVILDAIATRQHAMSNQ